MIRDIIDLLGAADWHIDDEDIKDVAEIGLDIQSFYGKPMDIEWCIEDDRIYIVQARPVTWPI